MSRPEPSGSASSEADPQGPRIEHPASEEERLRALQRRRRRQAWRRAIPLLLFLTWGLFGLLGPASPRWMSVLFGSLFLSMAFAFAIVLWTGWIRRSDHIAALERRTLAEPDGG